LFVFGAPAARHRYRDEVIPAEVNNFMAQNP
jgi:hypothetical protein